MRQDQGTMVLCIGLELDKSSVYLHKQDIKRALASVYSISGTSSPLEGYFC